MAIIAQKHAKKTSLASILRDEFKPATDADRRIVEALAAAGYAVVFGFPVWADGQYRLRGHRRLIVKAVS